MIISLQKDNTIPYYLYNKETLGLHFNIHVHIHAKHICVDLSKSRNIQINTSTVMYNVNIVAPEKMCIDFHIVLNGNC